MVVEPSMAGHGFEVGDMVWAKLKSSPWWPGHVYSEEFATPLVRQSKRDGLLLVAFFGASSYGWFDSSELISFDSNYAEKCLQTNSRAFVRAVKDAMEEVSRRSGLGLSCMCRNKQNFRQIDVHGFLSVDVAGFDPGVIYSIDAIGKARDSFQPKVTLDFLRQVALEPTVSEHVDIDFIKNKATVMSYRKAVYEDFDQAFGYDPVLTSLKKPAPREASSKAPLSGREVFADSLGKVKNTEKLVDHAKKDEYLSRRRGESQEIKKGKEKAESSPLPVLDPTIVAWEFTLKHATGSLKDTSPTVFEFNNPSFKISTSIVESPTSSSVAEVDQAKARSVDGEKRIMQEVEDRKVTEQDDFPSPRPHKIVAFQTVVSGPEKAKIPKRPVGELGSGISITPEKIKNQKKEEISLVENISVKKTAQSEGPQRSDGNYEMELSRVLGDLLSLAVDPFNTVNRGSHMEGKKAFLRFRSLVFQKSQNFSLPLASGEPSASNSSVDSIDVPHVKLQGGIKRGPSDLEEIAVAKRKRVGDIRNLIKEKRFNEPLVQEFKQPVTMTLEKPGPEFTKKIEQQAPRPTMLMIRFPQGGSLPSFNELEARFACYGPMDHSATQIFRNTFLCQVVFRHNVHAQAAYSSVVGSSSLFGNTDVKCRLIYLKEVGDMSAAEPEPPVEVPKEDHHQPVMENKPPSMVPVTSGVQLKSVLKISGSEEAAGCREVFADSVGKVMITAKPKDHAKKEETGLSRVLNDLHSLAVDPFNTVNRGARIKGKKVFLKFRSLAFQKSQNFSLALAAAGEPNASKSSEESVEVPPVKPQGGFKRGPSDPQEEMTAAKKKKVVDVRNFTKEKKVTMKIDEPLARQPVATTLKKPRPEFIKKTDPQAPEPTMLMIKLPRGGFLPSFNELKARFACYGPMDHSGTHIFWNTFTCQAVFRHKAHAEAAYRSVVESSSLFGNTGVKCSLKKVEIVGSAKPEPPVKVPKEDHQEPDVENRPPSMTSGVQLKSITKKSGGEEAADSGGRGRVKFMDSVGKNFQKSVHPRVVTSEPPPPPPPSMNYGATLLAPPSSPPLRVVNRPQGVPLMTPNADITQQMLTLLTRCHDVVTNVSSIFGYTPYHPL